MSAINQNLETWGHTAVKTKIKALAISNQTFTDVKEFFKLKHPDDERVVLAYYMKSLYESLPEKIRRHIYNLFENYDETLIAQWITFAYGNEQHNDDVRNLLQNVDFYQCLTDLEKEDKDFCFEWVFNFIKKCFREAFVERENLKGIIGIYQCLLRCKHSRHSAVFCNAVQVLWEKCEFKNDVLHLEPEKDAEVNVEHERLENLVSNFTNTNLENVKDLIKEVFKPTTMVFSSLSHGIKQILVIEGHKIALSAAYKEISERIKKNTKIKSVLIRANNLLLIDENVELPSVTFSCAAAEVVVPRPVTINLSGKDAEVDQTKLKPAKNGEKKGEKGEDGKDGTAGHPSGNFAIFTKQNIQGLNNLSFVLNGGNGTNGQDGGDSAEGEDGVGETFENLDSFKHEFEQACKRFGRIVLGGTASSIFSKKLKMKTESGGTKFVHESPYYLSLHTIDFIKGSDGKLGEKGGKNGLGGEGGKKGKCTIKINGIENPIIKIDSRDGEPGQNGLPGKNGGYGMEGWDIAKATKTFAKTKKYGTAYDEKLTVEYTTVKNDETFRVVAEGEGSESKRYAYIKREKCGKKDLKELELRTEYKDETERSGEAIAKEADAIETEKLNQDYENNDNITVNDEIQHETEEEIDFERIIEFCADLVEDEYIAKERPKGFMLPSKDIEDINLMDENSIFWKSTTDVSIESLFDKYKNSWVAQKLRKKQLIYKMRTDKAAKNDINVKGQNFYSSEVLTSMTKNLHQYYALFAALRNVKINGRNIDFFLPSIEKAFTKNKGLRIFEEYIVSSVDVNLKQKLLNPVFGGIRKAYEQLSDDIKKYDPILLFFYFILCENFVVCNVFSETALYEIDDNVFQNIKTFLILKQKRGKQAKKFIKQLNIWTKKYACDYDITFIGAPFVANLSLKINELLTYVEATEISTCIYNEIEILCTTFPTVGITFLNTLLLIFEVEGFQIDIITLKYLIDTVFDACSMYGIFDCYVFPAMLLTKTQEKWLDEFVFFNIETNFNCGLERKIFLKTIKKIKDENLKILCTKKLSNMTLFEKMTDETLLDILKALKKNTYAYPLLKDIKLNEWKINLEQNFTDENTKSPQWNALDENKKKNVMFWFCKLSEKFDNDNARTVFNNLIELSYKNKNVVGRFMHRLCSDEFVVDIKKQPLKDIFKAALDCLSKEMFPNNDEEVYKIAKELIGSNLNIDKPVLRKLEDIKTLFKNLNPFQHETFQNVLNMVSIVFGEDINTAINACAMINPKDNEYTTMYDIYKEKFKESLFPEDLILLEIFDAILHKKREIRLRLTQKIAILSALQHDPNETKTGILQQVATGEGKTIIITAVSIISALKGHTVNIITSSPVLAKRDVSSMKPLYEAFNLKVDHIYHKCSQTQNEIYNKCHVIYGDLTTFQRDFLMDKYLAGDRGSAYHFKIVIVDEVDSLLLDNGLNTLYLSHKTADFEMLHSVIIQIWNLVNQHVKCDGKCKNNESFYQKVYAAFFPMISWQEFPNCLEILEEEASNIKNMLIENHVVEESGLIIVPNNEMLREKLETLRNNFEKIKSRYYCIFRSAMAQEKNPCEINITEYLDSLYDGINIPKTEAENFARMLKQHGILNDGNYILITEEQKLQNLFIAMEKRYFDIILRFEFMYEKVLNTTVVHVPEHLQLYVKTHLKSFIDNAELALQMEADVQYQVTIPTKTKINEKVEPQVVIVDRDTGVHQPKAHWHKGLHQFLQLKHGLRLTALSTKALFISNISYFRKFNCIYGFSGTLGSKLEKNQLQGLYGLKSVVVPSSNVKQFYEERTIFTSNDANHYKEIFNAIHDKLIEGRSILVIADSIKQVMHITKNVKEMAEAIPDNQRKPFDSIILYKYDYENSLEKIKELDGKRIIIATTLAGRGIDIKLTKELREKGGLHVIVAFHPRNIRIEEQAFGRAARCGECGTAQLIVCDKHIKDEASANILELKWKRNINEKAKMEKIKEHYENRIKVQKKCFSLFSTKYDDVIKALHAITEDLKNREIEKECIPKSPDVDTDIKNISQNNSQNDINNAEKNENKVVSTPLLLNDEKDAKAIKNDENLKQLFEEHDEHKKILIDDMLDKWALFLDKCEYECTSVEEKIEATKIFCNSFDAESIHKPTQPLNILRCTIIKIKKKQFAEAKVHLKHLATEFPAYLPEAQYYSFYLDSKENEGKKQLTKAEKNLQEIKMGFTKRFSNYIKNAGIVEKYIVQEENRIFKCDTFMQQQKESMLFINKVIESLDGFFGQIIEPNVFTSDRICEEASMSLFKYFSNSTIFGKHIPITGLRIKKEFDEAKLQSYCMHNGFGKSDLKSRLNNLTNADNICVKSLKHEMKNPQWDEFWMELNEQNLLKQPQTHMFINTLKIPKLSAKKFDQYKLQPRNETSEKRLYKHLFVTDAQWNEVEKDEIKKNIERINVELFNLLIENGIICETESGILDNDFYENSNVKLQHYFTVDKDDLILYGIPEAEAVTLLKKLEDEHIFVQTENDKYQLCSSLKLDNHEWYSYLVMKMVKQKLAFGSAYFLLKEDETINKETLLKLSLIFNDNDETFISELTDAGILEKTNVNLLNLNEVNPEANFIRKKWEGFFDTESAFNILKALEDAEEFIEKVFGEENVGFSIKRAKWYKGMLPNPDVVKINEIFEESAAIYQKWQTFDIKLVPIKETMLNESEDCHLMITHGLTHLINFHEKRWSKKSLKKATAITVLGLGEFAVGCAAFFPWIALTTTGIGAVAAATVVKPFIFEGFNDLVFGLKSFYTGHCNGWFKYKMINMALNLTFIGGTQILKFMKFAEFSLLKAIFSRTDAAISGVVNAGKHAITSMSSSLSKIKENEDKFHIAQNGTKFVVEEINKHVQSHIDMIFASNESTNRLHETVKEYLKKKFGYNSNCIVDNDNFDKFVKPAMLEICYTMVAELRSSILEDNEVKKENTFEVRIKNIIHLTDFKKLVQSFENKLLLCIQQLQATLNAKLKRNNDETNFAVNEKVVEENSILLMDKWKFDIQEKCKSLLKDKVEIPLNYENEAEYQKQLNSILTTAYSERQIHASFCEVNIDNPNSKSKPSIPKKIADEFEADFFIKLQQLLERTHDPAIYAAALINGSNIDDFGAKILSELISKKLAKSVVISNSEMLTEDNTAAIKIVIDQNNDMAPGTVFDQIIHSLPELQNETKVAFQNALANEVANKSLWFSRNINVDIESSHIDHDFVILS